MNTPTIFSLVRDMKHAEIDRTHRRKLLEHPGTIAGLVTKILSLEEPIKDVYMSALGMGNDVIAGFYKQIGEKSFHQSYELFRALESFFNYHYELDLGVYIINGHGRGNGELLVGNQNTHKRDMHLYGGGTGNIEDYKNERLSMRTKRFESCNCIEGDGGKGAISIDIPGGKTAILSFGDMGSGYKDILKIRQLFERCGFGQIIRAKLEHIHKVYKDPLTGLYNREYFDQIAEKHAYSIVNIDLDNFKTVNDTFGHAIGDKVLREVGTIIETAIRKNDKACRFGGDEFILLIDTREESVLQNIANTIGDELHKNALIQSLNKQTKKQINASVGWCVFQKNIPLEERLKIADQRMYATKVKKSVSL